MLVAQEKYKTNIAEYLLYMWQIEDLIRGFHLNADDIYFNVVEPAGHDEKTARLIRSWYEGLIEKMRIQSIDESGHLHELREIVNSLQEIHQSLLQQDDKTYRKIFLDAREALEEFSRVSKESTLNEVEIALNALHMKLLLRLQGKKITDASEEAFNAFSRMISYVASIYHQQRDAKSHDFSLN